MKPQLTFWAKSTLGTIIVLILVHGALNAQTMHSYYVPVEDGTRLAVDVHLPASYKKGKLPVLMVFTRYWRSSISNKTKEPNPPLDKLDTYFSENGYVIVKVDARGTGASFGFRPGEYTPVEVRDASSIVDWVTSQSWCDGNVGAYGTSYSGTTAELLCAINHPAVKAVIPGWSDFDVYRSPVRPYGMLASGFIKKWSRYVWMLDKNFSLILGESVRPVSKDSLKLALAEHKQNPNIYKFTKNAPYRDSKIGDYSYEDCSPIHWKAEIEKSNIPMLVLTSWMDAGTSEGTLNRLQYFSNPQKVVMMATSHGGWSHASPFVVGAELLFPNPRIIEQNKLQLAFFDQYVKGIEAQVEEWPTIRYYNLGEEKFKESDVWPVNGMSQTAYYLHEDGGLSMSKPVAENGSDNYKVDFSVSTGKVNRWTTQMGGPVMNLDNRNSSDLKMLTYTSKPAETDIQITGTPVISLQMSTTHTDGAVFVYLEDVDEHGISRYITEGGLRLSHRKLLMSPDDQFNAHSFEEEEFDLMVPNKVEEIVFKFWPTSVLIKKGHSIRIAIAGADKETFDRLPKRGKPTMTIHRSATKLSFINLPVVGS